MRVPVLAGALKEISGLTTMKRVAANGGSDRMTGQTGEQS